MLRTIRVTPVAEGWEVTSASGEPLLFQTSAQAVWSARKLGETLAEAGHEAEVVVMQKNGRIAGRYRCHPALELELAG
jgi:hypothetical protein